MYVLYLGALISWIEIGDRQSNCLAGHEWMAVAILQHGPWSTDVGLGQGSL